MKTALFLLALLAVLPAHAQTSTRREVPKGEITGLEMQIEGSLRATAGDRLRWFVTVYEVVRGRELRPAADATLSAEASYHRSEAVAKAVTDADGRAALSIDIPAELTGSFDLGVKVRARQVIRQFDAKIELLPRYRTELEVDRPVFEPGETVYAWGRVMDAARQRPAAQREVLVTAVDGKSQPLSASVTRKTDDAGFFHVSLPAPAQEGISFAIEASLLGDHASAKKAGLGTARLKLPALVVYAAPERQLVAPGAEVWVNAVVRTPDGRPVPGATLTGLSIPKSSPQKPVPPVVTDARGRARVPWKVASTSVLADVTGELQAVREGIGTGKGVAAVRVTRRTQVLSWAVEGNALIPGLPGQLFVRLYGADGKPRVGTELRLTGGRLSAAAARTDAQGMAVLPTSLATSAGPQSESCTGDTVAAATLSFGGEEEELCLPVDPDATVRVRSAPLLSAGSAVEVRLQRAAPVAGAKVEVALLASAADGHWMPVAKAVAPAASQRIMLEVPPQTVGLVWLRARPLIGPLRREVRGGGTAAWALPGPAQRLQLTASKDEAQLTLAGEHRPASSFVLALPVAAGEKLLAGLTGPMQALGGDLSSSQLRGYLAASTPTDEVVAAVLREGLVLPLLAPADPVVQGRLRDPLRSQERYVRGRLARVLHAIEEQVAQAIPEGLDNVAFRGPQGYRYNREIMNLIAPELGAEGLAGLDGNPLTIELLQALDPAVTYDNAARRITRERLLRLYIALDHFVRDKQLGYAWARRGDPSRWLLGLIDFSDSVISTPIKREDLFDAWGHPFALHRARSGKTRFPFLEPVAGWELVSPGPDGKLDTADDMATPFARVLASGTLYAEAVGEDVLLARLSQVELGHATIQELGKLFEVEAAQAAPKESTAPSSWSDPPAPLADPAAALAPAVVLPEPGSGSFHRLDQASTRVPLALSLAPRRYLLVAGAYQADGTAVFAGTPLTAGVPLLVDAALPERLQPGETVRVPLTLTYLGVPQQLTVRAESSGPIKVSLDTAALKLEAGQARSIELALSALQRGSGAVRIIVSDASDAVLLGSSRPVQVVEDGVLRAQHAGHVISGTEEEYLTLPAGAEFMDGQLVISGARDLVNDPGFLPLFQTAPALAGWAYALRGQPLPAKLASALAAWSPGTDPLSGLQSACAVVAFSAGADPDAPSADLQRALRWVSSMNLSGWRERSAVLAALAASAPAPAAVAGSGDAVAAFLRRIRQQSWEILASQQSHPAVLARLAAGLLLADRRDAVGRELFERARPALVPSGAGARMLTSEEGALDAWIGTAALAVAARQLGQDSLAEELARGLAPRMFLGMQSDVEASFWLLAASVYGVFGVEAPEDVEVELNGTRQQLKIAKGCAVLPLSASDLRTVVHSKLPVLLRMEAHYRHKAGVKNDAPLSVRIEGHVGHASETAALELTVEDIGKQTVARPVLELTLPGLSVLEDEARARLAATPGVLRVEAPDLGGVIRIHLQSLDPRAPRRLPLPIRWLGAGQVHGLGVTAYSAEQPWNMTTIPSRTIELKSSPKETW